MIMILSNFILGGCFIYAGFLVKKKKPEANWKLFVIVGGLMIATALFSAVTGIKLV